MASFERWYHDPQRGGIPTIRHSRQAQRPYPTPEDVKAWMGGGGSLAAPYDVDVDYDRCEGCGRATQCACGKDCPYCDENGVPTGTGP